MKFSNVKMLALVAAAGTTATAYAQPAIFTDLGDRSAAAATTSTPLTLASHTDIQWFRVILPAVSSGGGYVDIWTTPTGSDDIVDTEVGLYLSTGALKNSDDDSGPGAYSQLSYGSTLTRGATTAVGETAGNALSGQQGALVAGTYYMAVGEYNTAFAANFAVTSSGIEQSGFNANLNLAVQPATAPIPPAVSGGVSNPASGPAGISGSRLLTVTVTGGANPASPISSVVSDLSAFGGPASASFHDDGLNGDVTSGDGVYSYLMTGVSGPVGTTAVTVTATDGLARSGSGTVNVTFFSSTNLGDLSAGSHSLDSTVNLTSAPELQWFRVVLPPVNAAGAGFVDIWTAPTTSPASATDIVDTEIGLYASDGSGAGVNYNDDDSGPGNYSLLTYGSTTSRGAVTTSAGTGDLRDGFNGALAGGEYYLVVGAFNVTFATPGFGASGAYAGTQRDTVVHIETLDNTAPTNPVLSAGAASPVAGTSGTPVTISVTAAPGTNPTSGSITVTANLTALGGGSSVAMTDPELDGTYSVSTTIPAGATDFSAYSVQIDAVDDTSRAATPVTVVVKGQATPIDEATLAGGDAGDSLATAGNFTGSGAMNAIVGSTDATTDIVDVYKIRICDEAAFIASTEQSTGGPDTQLFLFDSAGMGVETNDDTPAGVGPSRIDSSLVTADGEYYLAVSRYNVDPVDAAAALIFPNTFGGINGPNAGVGALDHFVNVPISSGAYRLSLAGVCFPAPAQCSPADVGVQGGGPGQDNTLNNNDFIAFIDLFFSQSASADLGSQGGVQGSDGLWDNNDFIVFIDYFFNDAANCQG